MTAVTHAATAPSAVDWRTTEGCAAAEPSCCFLFFAFSESAVVELLAADSLSAAEPVSFEHPVTPATIAASAPPAIQPTVLFLWLTNTVPAVLPKDTHMPRWPQRHLSSQYRIDHGDGMGGQTVRRMER